MDELNREKQAILVLGTGLKKKRNNRKQNQGSAGRESKGKPEPILKYQKPQRGGIKTMSWYLRNSPKARSGGKKEFGSIRREFGNAEAEGPSGTFLENSLKAEREGKGSKIGEEKEFKSHEK